ncbi:MAG: NUDIX domain-containing protein [Patescibacteria group bacterium]
METYVITSAIIRNGNKFLIAKRAKTKKFAPNQWEFISGFMDTPETAEETILREIKEELGVEGKIIDTSTQFDVVDDEGNWTVIPFLVELNTSDIEVHPEDHSEVKWVMAHELNAYPDLKLFLDNEGIQKFLKN